MFVSQLNREELKSLPLKRLQLLDVRNTEEERVLQDIINEKMISVPSAAVTFPRQHVPDIKNVEQEKEWQEKIDAYEEKFVPLEVKIKKAEAELEHVNTEIENTPVPEVIPTKVEPEQVVQQPEVLPVESTPVEPEAPAPIEEPTPEVTPENVAGFACECGKSMKTEAALKAHKTRFHK